MGQLGARPARFRLSRKILVAAILIAIIITGVVVYIYNSMSVTSVTSIASNQVQAVRIFTNGTFPNRIATYLIEVQVWSKARALDVSLGPTVLQADLDRVPLGNQTFEGTTIMRGAYLTYNLRFNINESKAVGTISGNANDVGVKILSVVQAGFYSQTVTLTTSGVWSWTAATLLVNGGCFDITFNINC